MCGIAGLLGERPFGTVVIAEALQRLDHRGPDDHGWALVASQAVLRGRGPLPPGETSGAALAHTRLSIVDLSDAAAQPMSTADGRYHIVYNGEVYNHVELRKELEGAGRTFASHSDTEVVLAAFAEWGTTAFSRFVGMFALVVVDRVEGVATLARDPFGIKPLYHARCEAGLAFASEIPALFAFPGVSRAANVDRVHAYLTSSIGETSAHLSTAFAEIRPVPPGHYLQVPLERPHAGKPIAFWRPPRPGTRNVPYVEAVAKVRDLFLESVRLHLRSDVPVGATLSGGIDSSAVVMAMRRLLGDGAPIHTFSYIADQPELNEERWVDAVNAAAGATPHKVHTDGSWLRRDLPQLIHGQGEPFPSTSIYAQYCVFDAAKRAGIKVTLDGQGADELLAGYHSFHAARLTSLLLGGRWVSAARLYRALRRLPGARSRALARETADRVIPRSLVKMLMRTPLAGARFRPDWLDASWFRARGVGIALEPMPARRGLARTLVRTATESSLPELLRYADRNSMAFSVESRVPFLTPALAEYLLSLPEEYLLGPDGTSKRVFRDAMRGLVPGEILDRRDKIGFTTAERDWLLGLDPWVREVLGRATPETIPFLRPDTMRAEWDEIVAGTKPYRGHVWRWLNLILWAETFAVLFDDAAAPVPEPVSDDVPREQVPATPQAVTGLRPVPSA